MTSPRRLNEVFVELADTLVADFDVVDFMTTLAARCVELLDVSEAGVMLADEHGVLRWIASSNETARLLEIFELQNDEGPCVDCYRSGQALQCSLMSRDERWPRFGPEARRLGFATVCALPMRLRGRVIGAVNILDASEHQLGTSDISLGQALADVATIGLLQHRGIREASVLNEQLQRALTSRIVIEQAKGMLAERRAIEIPDAFEVLRGHARGNNKRLSDVAQAFVDGTLSLDV